VDNISLDEPSNVSSRLILHNPRRKETIFHSEIFPPFFFLFFSLSLNPPNLLRWHNIHPKIASAKV